MTSTIRYVLRDRATQGVDFLLWGDNSLEAAMDSLDKARADGLDVELVTMRADAMDEHTRRLIEGPPAPPVRPHGVFPCYDLDTLPAIPADWQDCSWHNDACPSWEAPNGLVVFVDYAEVSERETGPGPRYSITRCYGDPDADLLATDDWSEVLRTVAAYKPARNA